MAHEPGTVLKQLVKLPKDPAGCWKWLGQVNNRGCPVKQHNGRPIAARRWLWSQLFGDVPDGLEVFNTCGDLSCVSPHHMRCGTPMDRVAAGPLANLTPGDVAQIRKAKNAGPFEKKGLAMQLGVPLATLNDIWSGRAWKKQPAKPATKEQADDAQPA